MQRRTRWLDVILGSMTWIFTLAAGAATPLGLPTETERANEPELALAELGRQLFLDKRLSADGSMSCASCHHAERQFTDGLPTAHGLGGRVLTRHTPSLLNVRYATTLFWDGRSSDLAAQARSPLLGPAEHGLADEAAIGQIVRHNPAYTTTFERLLGTRPIDLSVREVTQALAAYERTLVAGNSPFDRYAYGHEAEAMTPAAVRGLTLFRGKAQCEACHRIGTSSALFTDGDFHMSPLPVPASALSELGTLTKKVEQLRKDGAMDALSALIVTDPGVAALGRFVVTLDPKDIGRFKTASLRNVAVSGPYMHDGSISALPQAIELELYTRSSQRYPLILTQDERADLLEFLKALTSS